MKCKIFTLGQGFRPLLGRPVLLLFLLLVIFFVLSLNRYVILLNEFESEFSEKLLTNSIVCYSLTF